MTTLTDEGWLNRPVGVPVPSARLWAEIRVPIPDFAVRPLMVESRCGAVTVGLASLLPPLSVGGAL